MASEDIGSWSLGPLCWAEAMGRGAEVDESHSLPGQPGSKKREYRLLLDFFFLCPILLYLGMVHPHSECVFLPHSPREAFTFRDVLTDAADSYLAKPTQMANHHTFIYVARWMQPVAWECSGSAFTGSPLGLPEKHRSEHLKYLTPG